MDIKPTELMCILELSRPDSNGDRENVIANVNDEFLDFLAYAETRVWLYKITGVYDGVDFDPMWRW